MNQTTVTGKWTELKGEIKSQWGKLTDDELEKAKGNLESITGLIQQRYGDAKEASAEKVKSLFAKFADKTEDVKEAIRDKAKQ